MAPAIQNIFLFECSFVISLLFIIFFFFLQHKRTDPKNKRLCGLSARERKTARERDVNHTSRTITRLDLQDKLMHFHAPELSGRAWER